MKKKLLLVVALTMLTFLMLPRVVRAQFAVGINAGITNPMRGALDSLPGLRSGYSIACQPSYTINRIRLLGYASYQQLNTANGFAVLAKQYGYTSEKGFTLTARSGGLMNLGLGVDYNLLSIGVTSCGTNKPALFVGAGGGVLVTAGKMEEAAVTKAGETAFSMKQGSNAAVPYYQLRAQLLIPIVGNFWGMSSADWNRSTKDLSFDHSGNGGVGTSHFNYSVLQVSIGIVMTLKGIQEKGIKRAETATLPAVHPGDDAAGSPQARTTGQPIGGIVVKGGQNPGTKPIKSNSMTTDTGATGDTTAGDANSSDATTDSAQARSEGAPIKGVIVKGNRTEGAPIKGVIVKGNRSDITEGNPIPGVLMPIKGRVDAMVTGNPIPGVVVKGGSNGTKLTITKKIIIKDMPLLTSLGADRLVIAKGEYAVDYDTPGEARAIVHLHRAAIIHRDLAARSFAYHDTDTDGNTFRYTIEPIIENGVVKDLLVTYKGIQEKGIK